MDPWIEDVRKRHMTSPLRVEHWQPIIDMHRWRDEMAALCARCPAVFPHVATQLQILDRWFCFARDSAGVESMRWLEWQIEVTVAWARAVLDGAPGRCEAHDEPLSLIGCATCSEVSGVGCGYGCGARRACERCWERAPDAVRSARKAGFPDPPDAERRRGRGPVCWGCGARGVPLAASCGYKWADDGSGCPRAVCAQCHRRGVPCNACAPYFPSAPRPIFTR